MRRRCEEGPIVRGECEVGAKGMQRGCEGDAKGVRRGCEGECEGDQRGKGDAKGDAKVAKGSAKEVAKGDAKEVCHLSTSSQPPSQPCRTLFASPIPIPFATSPHPPSYPLCTIGPPSHLLCTFFASSSHHLRKI